MPFITVIDYDTISTFTDGGYGPVNEMDMAVYITTETSTSVKIIPEVEGAVTMTVEATLGVRL
jgi:hypothetical protein